MIRGYSGFWGGVTKGALDTHRALLEEEELEEKKKDRELARRLGDIQIRLGEASLQRVADEQRYQDEMRSVIERITTREEPEVGPHGEVYNMKRVPKPYDPIVLTKEMVGVAARYGRLGPTQVLEMEKKLKELKDTRVFEAYQAMQAGDNQRAAEILKNVGVSIDPTTLMGYKEKGPFGLEYDVFVARTPDGGHFNFNPRNLINNVAFKGLLGLQQAEALFALKGEEIRALQKKSDAETQYKGALAEYYKARGRGISDSPKKEPFSEQELLRAYENALAVPVLDSAGKVVKGVPSLFRFSEFTKLYDQYKKRGLSPVAAREDALRDLVVTQTNLLKTVEDVFGRVKNAKSEDVKLSILHDAIKQAEAEGLRYEDLERATDYLRMWSPLLAPDIRNVVDPRLLARARKYEKGGGQVAAGQIRGTGGNPSWNQKLPLMTSFGGPGLDRVVPQEAMTGRSSGVRTSRDDVLNLFNRN